MADLDSVQISGRLTQTPKLKSTKGDTALCEISLAVNGRKEDQCDFVDVTFWGKQAEVIAEYLQKGRYIIVTGRLKLDRWEDKESGQKRTRLGVIGNDFSFVPDGTKQNSTKKETVEEHDTSNEDSEAVPF